jgi:hypothetical protein
MLWWKIAHQDLLEVDQSKISGRVHGCSQLGACVKDVAAIHDYETEDETEYNRRELLRPLCEQLEEEAERSLPGVAAQRSKVTAKDSLVPETPPKLRRFSNQLCFENLAAYQRRFEATELESQVGQWRMPFGGITCTVRALWKSSKLPEASSTKISQQLQQKFGMTGVFHIPNYVMRYCRNERVLELSRSLLAYH